MDIIKEKGREMELENQLRKFGFNEIMTEQIVKPEEIDDFIPRKLFFFGVENFKNCAKEIDLHINRPEVTKHEMQSGSGSSQMPVAEQKCATTNINKKQKKSKTTNTVMTWAKRAFGRK
uniref:Uncharacterized protein LOC111111804 n=1 Tax=Crassostrea virginica TaxID=6565 RepID=A0A8B8BMU8_CRAVI|nr:uncharacterized protein LOC111111804 [Crassostrea virginica]